MTTRHIILTLTTLTLLSGCPSKEEPETPAWRKPATLHDASIARWRASSEAEQLATAADFYEETHRAWVMTNGHAGLKAKAEALRDCINQADASRKAQKRQVSDLAAACMFQP